MKKNKNRVSGSGSDDMIMEILQDLTPGAGMIAAYEIKNLVGDMESVSTALGDNKDLIMDGLGVVVGLGAPHLITDPKAKQYARGFGAGFAGQCLYSLYINQFRSESAPAPNAKVRGWDNAAYSLAKARAAKKLAGRDNAAPGLMGDKRRIDEIGASLPKPRAAGYGI